MAQNVGTLTAPSAVTPLARARQARLRTADFLESDRGGLILSATYAAVLGMSAAAAIVADPLRAEIIGLTAIAAAASTWMALSWRSLPGMLAGLAAIGAVALTGLYASATYGTTPTVVWLFAYLVPAIGMARGPLLGGLAGLVAAPVLHQIETGVVFNPLDPQWPFGVLILVALGAAPGHLLNVARLRRVALDEQLARAIDLVHETERARSAETAANRQSVFMLARAAEARDGTTGAHIHHVNDLAAELAVATGASAAQAERIGWSAMLHDVGKLRVPDRILLKPGKLDTEEWETIQRHSEWGEALLEGGEHFALARRIARWHHENWDGSGYPDRISGNQIPPEARMVRIVDVYDALRSERPYKRAWSEDEVLAELRRLREIHFDPELTDLFLRLRGA